MLIESNYISYWDLKYIPNMMHVLGWFYRSTERSYYCFLLALWSCHFEMYKFCDFYLRFPSDLHSAVLHKQKSIFNIIKNAK